MKPTEILQTTDGFSWQRTAMVGRYFKPLFIKKLLGFFILSTLFFIGGCFSLKCGSAPSTSATFFNIPLYILIASPLVFSARHDREIFKTLPALTDEKCTVIAFFCFILVPVAALLPGFVGSALIGSEISTPDFHINFIDEHFSMCAERSSWLASVAIIYFALFATNLWGVFALNPKKLYYVIFLVVFLLFVIKTLRGEIASFNSEKALTTFDSLLLLYGILMMWKTRKAIE